MKRLEIYLIIQLAVLMLVTFFWGSKLSSPYLSGAIVLTMISVLINKFIYEFRNVK